MYATCSFLPEENEHIVEKFMAAHPDFKLVPASSVITGSRFRRGIGDVLKLAAATRHGCIFRGDPGTQVAYRLWPAPDVGRL